VRQCLLKITEYARSARRGFSSTLDFVPAGVFEVCSADWIGKSIGADVVFKVADPNDAITVFTRLAPTRLFGGTWVRGSRPEHPLVRCDHGARAHATRCCG